MRSCGTARLGDRVLPPKGILRYASSGWRRRYCASWQAVQLPGGTVSRLDDSVGAINLQQVTATKTSGCGVVDSV